MTLKISRSQVSTQPNPTQPMDGPNPWPTLSGTGRTPEEQTFIELVSIVQYYGKT